MYHAHLYFDHNSPAQLKTVEQVVSNLKEKFNLPVGKIHQRPVGPHPTGSCQIIFQEEDHDSFIKWLDQNRQGLDVLIHAVTGNEFQDHTKNVSWLGGSHSLVLSIFAKCH